MPTGDVPTYKLDSKVEADREHPTLPPEWRLVITGPGQLTEVPLLPGHEYTLGRGGDADIPIDDHAASRAHARIVIRASFVEVRDLSSQNGTTAAGINLGKTDQSAAVYPGQTINVGLTTLLVQRFAATVPRRRKAWSHLYFRVRVEEECERASLTGASFSIVRLCIGDNFSETDFGTALTGARDPLELVARFRPRHWDLLVRGGRPHAELRVKAIREALALGTAAPDLRWGIGTFGTDGGDPESLFSAATNQLRGERPTGSEEGMLAATAGPMRAILETAEKVAASQASVLILGETGVGKSLLARWIHDHSPRKAAVFKTIELPALPRDMIEAELFGHVKGSFTGAVSNTTGQLALADGGTLFLDEVGELPPNLQVKLLGFLQNREVRRIGEEKHRRVDVRIIAATNRDLRAAITQGEFRQDLYRRLNVIQLALPPLRKRRGEIEPLARAFLSRFAQREKRPVPELSPDALVTLEAHDWPENVGELEATMERALTMYEGAVIEPEDLGLTDLFHDGSMEPDESQAEDDDVSDLSEAQQVERRLVVRLLEKHRWKRDEAWRDPESQWKRTSFFKKMKVLGIVAKQ